jgi:hypothetical protein
MTARPRIADPEAWLSSSLDDPDVEETRTIYMLLRGSDHADTREQGLH